MPWVQKGFIFKPDGSRSWSRTHAQVPTAVVMDHAIRIYYATRDDKGRSRTGFIDVDKQDPSRILYDHDEPIMDLGKPGTHDDAGVMSSCFVHHGDEMLFYYTGWSLCQTVPYRVSAALAKSTDGGITFERVFEGPVVDRTPLEPYMTMSPYVIVTDGKWQMWYGSGIGWVEIDGKMETLYIIKYAESDDGLWWRQENITSIEQSHPLEAMTRASVLKNSDGYEMWFSHRHSVDFRGETGGFRIGYATSKDGKSWIRHADQEGLETAAEGWTKNMIAYCTVIELDGKRLMFHNGTGFGRSGFGYAVWED